MKKESEEEKRKKGKIESERVVRWKKRKKVSGKEKERKGRK